MAIDFPASPSTNDTFVAGSITYKWDGAKWIGLGVTPADRLLEGANSLEITASNYLVWTGDNVGINTNNPGRQLTLSHTSQAEIGLLSGADTLGGLIYQNASEQKLLIANRESDGHISFQTGGVNERVRVTSDGEVLIGTDIQNSFNGVGQAHNLIVAGSTSDTDITDNSKAAITISNTDGTADNTAGLHFAREDTDGNPHYTGASVVAQFKEAQVTGQYPKADLAFLTSIAANNAPSEKMRIKANGDIKHTGLRDGGGENKLAILVTPSHNTNEEDVIVYQVENESSFNQITFGGGTASYNAATKLVFKTASAVDTTGGTERFSIDTNGIVRSHSDGIDGSSLTLDLTSNQIVAGFQAKETSGNAQALSGFWFNHGGLNAGIASTRQVTNQWGTDIRFYTHPFTVSDQHKVYERFKIDPDGRIFFRDLLGNASSGSTVKYSNSDDELRYDTSSRLLKTNITECPYGIETVKKLKPSRYTPQEYDREGNINVTDEVLIGFIADEMVEEVPEVVQMYPKSSLTRNDEDTEIVPAAISYDKLTAVLTKALQEAIAEIETLRARLDAAGI